MQRRSILLVTLFVIVSVSATILTAFGIADYSVPVAMAQSQGTFIEASNDLASEFAQVNCQTFSSDMKASAGNIVIKTKESVGGAINNLLFKGIDIINSFDHGRQLQYAMTINGYGECYNPTEGGSQVNGAANLPSTSRLQASCKLAPNQFYTKTRMAYWLPAGASTGGHFCNGTTSKTTINTTNISEYKISKIVTVGHLGNENVIRMVSRVNIPERIKYSPIEIPTIYLNKEYRQVYRYDVNAKTITRVNNNETGPALSYLSFWKYYDRNTIGILSNGSTYVALYSPRANTNGVFKFDLNHSDPDADGTKLQAVYTIGERRADSIEYFESFVVVGGYDKVLTTLGQLIESDPMIYDPDGSVDVFRCDTVQGWACNPQDPAEVLNIEVYTIDKVTKQPVLVKTGLAKNESEQVINNLCGGGINKRYNLDLTEALRGLDSNFVEVYAVKADGSKYLLPRGLKKFTCN